jgi:hypothetical protein
VSRWPRAREIFAAFVGLSPVGCEEVGTTTPGGASACAFTVTKNEVSPKMATVGIVEWSLAGSAPSSARVVFELVDAGGSLLNRGGTTPVDLGKPGYRTLLLGLKQARRYAFRIEAERDGRTCVSDEYSLPATGTFADARPVVVSVTQPEKREPGFIVASSGNNVPSRAFIVDADGEFVWYAEAPENPSRALLDYEGEKLWMLSLNLTNEGGEMRYVSMDGLDERRAVSGLDDAHHDFTVMPGGKVAVLVWSAPGVDPESELVIRSADGTLENAFRIGANLYAADAYHANALHYSPFDDAFTIADRNPNVLVKVSAAGSAEWQLGGRCDDAPAGARCFAQTWDVIHGHHLLEDGTLVVFNNGYADRAHVKEFHLNVTPDGLTANEVADYAGTAASSNLGDVQRLPGGNTLVTYSGDRTIVELDSSWNEVQSFSVPIGYASWRQTLYGPPARL